jgi:tetratricopeptide (TPR) repeat protein
MKRPASSPETTPPHQLDRALEVGLLALVGLIPLLFLPWLLEDPTKIKDLVFGLGIAVLLALWVGRGLLAGRLTWPKSPLSLPLFFFLVVNLVSLSNSRFRGLGLIQLGQFASFAGFCFLIAATTRSRAQLGRLLVVVFASASLACLYGIVQHFGGDPIPWEKSGRILSSFGNPTYFAAYLILLFPIGLSLVLAPSPSAATPPRRRLWGRALLWKPALGLLAGAMLLCLVWTYTRAAWVGGALGVFLNLVAVLYLGKRGKRGKRLVWLPVAGIFLLLVIGGTAVAFRVPRSQLLRLLPVAKGAKFSDIMYVNYWQAAWETFLAHPLLGTGPGTYRVYSFPHVRESWYKRAAIELLVPTHAHAAFLEVLSDTGVVGLLVFLWLLAAAAGTAVVLFLRPGEAWWRFLAAGLFSGAFAFLAQNLAGVTFYVTGAAMFFWLALGLLTASNSIRAGEQGVKDSVRVIALPRSRWLKALAFAGMSALLAALAAAAGRSLAAEMHLAAGLRHSWAREWATARPELEAAARLAPFSLKAHYHLAYASGQLEDFASARESYRRALRLLPEDPELFYNLGTCEERLGNLKAAAEAFRETVRLFGVAENRYRLANVLKQRADQKRAEALIEAMEGRPGEAQEALKESLAYLHEAYQEIERATRLDMKMVSYRVLKGVILWGLGDGQAADTELQRVIYELPPAPEAEFELGNLYRDTGRYEDAVARYRNALKIRPSEARYLKQLAWAQLKYGKFQVAVSTLSQAIARAPDDAELRLWLGLAYSELGEWERALAQVEDAIRAAPAGAVREQAMRARQKIREAMARGAR